MTPELDRRRFLQLAGATAFVAACGGSTATASPSPSSAASATASLAPKATGRISIYSALNESTNNQLFAAFTKATGVEVSALPLAAAGDLQTKITAEKNNPQADIFVGGSSELRQRASRLAHREPAEYAERRELRRKERQQPFPSVDNIALRGLAQMAVPLFSNPSSHFQATKSR